MGRQLNPVEAARRSQKRRAAEKRKTARREYLTKVPLAKRDPSKLLLEIERLRELECENKLDGPDRMKRKHLEEQFHALNKAREKAKLPTLHLPDFDPDGYLERQNQLQRAGPMFTVAEPFTQLEELASYIPMPDDDSLEMGVPGLPPYLDHPLVEQQTDPTHIKITQSHPAMGSEEQVSKDARLRAKVDQFLEEIGQK